MNLPEFTHRAACAGATQPLWDTHQQGESVKQAEMRQGRAIGICMSCPAVDECFAYAMRENQHPDPSRHVEGVWGGKVMTPLHREHRESTKPRGPKPKDIAHGTPAGYRMHLRRDEPVCADCRQAETRTRQDRDRRQRAAS
jgi:hypothetical protein